MTEPLVQPVSGGRSARTSALVAVLLIVVVAWLGFAGRDGGEPAGSLPPAADASPSALATAADPSPSTAPTTEARPSPTRGPLPVVADDGPGDTYVVLMSIGRQDYYVALSDRSTDHLGADIRIPLPLAAPVASFSLVQLRSAQRAQTLVPVLATALPIETLLDDSARIIVVPGRPDGSGAPRLLRAGYMLTVGGESDVRHATLSVDVRVGGAPSLPLTRGAGLRTGYFETSLVGDERLLTVARLEGSTTDSFVGSVPLPAAWRFRPAALRIAWSDGQAGGEQVELANLTLAPNELGSGSVHPLSDEVVRLERRIDGVRRWRYRVTLQDLGSDIALLAVELQPAGPMVIGDEPDNVTSQPRFEAHLLNEDRLTGLVRLGGSPPGTLTAHVIAHERDGQSPRVDLVAVGRTDVEVVASHNFQMRQLRRGYPEELVGQFRLSATGGGEETWQYRITPHGTGSGVMLLVEARRLADVAWSCWSNGDLC